MKDERGFALIITLIITALLVALCVEFVDEVFVDTSARANFVAAQQASLLAESGVNGGIKLLQNNLSLTGGTYSSLLAPWAKPLVIDDENGHLSVTIEEENSKLNINQIFGPNGKPYQVNHDIAVRLFKKLGLSPDLLDALNDWVDDSGVTPLAGAKSPYYNTLKPPYNAKNGPLDTVEELALVKGFTSPLVQQFRPYVTIYTDMPGQININTAPEKIIAALDDRMTDSLTKQVLDYRKTTPFQQASDLARVPGMETIALGLLTNITPNGTVYRIISQATVGETTRIIEAVVRINGTYLYWREY